MVSIFASIRGRPHGMPAIPELKVFTLAKVILDDKMPDRASIRLSLRARFHGYLDHVDALFSFETP